ncbi:Centromere protein F, partial [Chaetura pelagica]
QLQLTVTKNNELIKSLEIIKKERQKKESEMQREISEYQNRLLQAEKEHQDALTQKNEVEVKACQDKINSLEHFITSQKLEIERLKLNEEKLNNCLKEANHASEELLKLKVR